MILYFATDLIWATKIKGTADALGLACRPVRTLAMLEDRLADSVVKAVLLDLDVPETAMAFIARLKRENDEKASGIRVVAWGPHVEKALFQQAREAGANEVLTRGALDRDMVRILTELAGGQRA